MRIKIITALLCITLIGMVIYFEQYNNPYVNFDFITNNKKNTNSISNNHSTIDLPNFELNLINNQKIKIHDIKSDNLIIHFWASWCHVCTEEFEDIIKFSKKHSNTTIVTIAIDDDKDKLDAFINNLKVTYGLEKSSNLLFVWDKNKDISLNIFNTETVPENYIVKYHDSHYEITEKIIGKTKWHNIL